MSSPGYELADLQRWVAEPPKRPGRSEFARDRARVLHSAAWRRLAAKTQVMIAGEGDFPRTRMTHSLEVAQVGRELGAALGCDPDLVEAACLAHDLGHPPFGHNGEDVLDQLCSGIGGFEGNAQTLRVLTRLEAKAFGQPAASPPGERSVGLNLTRATLDAATKYPWPRGPSSRKFGAYPDDMPAFLWMRAGAPDGQRCFEAQVMDWADDVAYSVHDVEDGIHAGHIDLRSLHDRATAAALVQLVADEYLPGADPAELADTLDRLLAAPFWPVAYTASLRDLAALKDMASRLIGRFTAAAEVATREAHEQPQLARYLGTLEVPDHIRREVSVLKGIANLFVMQRKGSAQTYRRQHAMVQELAATLVLAAPACLEPHFRPSWEQARDDGARHRVIVDQIASLTDISLVAWHRRHCR
ncbi:MAG: deoxyguanosinetriphosphate triphosphohydrolase [Candidatus Nanopelagicales bacterium]